MFSVCLIHEDREPEWYNQWSYVLSHWKPHQLFVVGDDINTSYRSFKNAVTIKTTIELPDLPLIVLQPETASEIKPQESLLTFTHPTDCVYVFGADHRALPQSIFDKPPTSVVYIPTDSDLEMYSWVAGAVTLYDRMSKNG